MRELIKVVDSKYISEQASLVMEYADIDFNRKSQMEFARISIIAEAELFQWGLHAAENRGQVKDWLREGAPINGLALIEYGDGHGHLETPLLTALIDERLDAAAALIKSGADVDAPNSILFPTGGGFAHTTLHMVARRGLVDGVKMLIAAGANVNRRTTMGTTALHFAAELDHVEVVKLLIRAGANKNVREFPDGMEGIGNRPVDGAGPKSRSLLS